MSSLILVRWQPDTEDWIFALKLVLCVCSQEKETVDVHA